MHDDHGCEGCIADCPYPINGAMDSSCLIVGVLRDKVHGGTGGEGIKEPEHVVRHGLL